MVIKVYATLIPRNNINRTKGALKNGKSKMDALESRSTNDAGNRQIRRDGYGDRCQISAWLTKLDGLSTSPSSHVAAQQ